MRTGKDPPPEANQGRAFPAACLANFGSQSVNRLRLKSSQSQTAYTIRVNTIMRNAKWIRIQQ